MLHAGLKKKCQLLHAFIFVTLCLFSMSECRSSGRWGDSVALVKCNHTQNVHGVCMCMRVWVGLSWLCSVLTFSLGDFWSMLLFICYLLLSNVTMSQLHSPFDLGFRLLSVWTCTCSSNVCIVFLLVFQFLPTSQNMPVGVLATLNCSSYEYVSVVPCSGLAFHPVCIPALHSVFTG